MAPTDCEAVSLTRGAIRCAERSLCHGFHVKPKLCFMSAVGHLTQGAEGLELPCPSLHPQGKCEPGAAIPSWPGSPTPTGIPLILGFSRTGAALPVGSSHGAALPACLPSGFLSPFRVLPRCCFSQLSPIILQRALALPQSYDLRVLPRPPWGPP